MESIDKKLKRYMPVIVFIFLTVYSRYVSWTIGITGIQRRLGVIDRNVETLLKEYDFTGMTSIFINVITVLNLIFLLFYLYLIIKEEKHGFSDFFYKIFTVFSIILIMVSISSFIIIRSTEEAIVKEFINKLYNFQNELKKTHRIKDGFEYLNEGFALIDDEFYEVKLRINSEMESENTFWRYLWAFFFKSRLDHETMYYNLFSQFALLDFLLFLYFGKRMKSNDIEEKVILSLFRKR